MGMWELNIQGEGCPRNDKPEIDVYLAAKEFVKTMHDRGHTGIQVLIAFDPQAAPIPDDGPPPEPQKKFDITINGKALSVDGPQLKYSDIHQLYYGTDAPAAALPMVVYYHWEGGIMRQGHLSNGQSVGLQNGMVFSLAYTGNG